LEVLVTGANGFVGAALCRVLVREGYKVKGLIRKTSDLSLLAGLDVELVYGSLQDSDSLQAACRGVEIVYHVAAAVSDWGSFKYFRQINVEGTRNILDAAVAVKASRFVLVSSVAVHSFIDSRNMDEDSPQLITEYPYCLTKREAETLAMAYHQQGKIEVAIARPGDVWGPGDRTSLLKMAPLLEAGQMGYIGGGRKLGAFTYIENLAEGLFLAGIKPAAAGEAFILTDGVEVTWRSYFEKLTDELDVPKPKFSVPPAIAWAIATVMEGIFKFFKIKARPPLTRYLVDHMRCDTHFSIRKARDLLGYNPAISMDEGMIRTAEWYIRLVRK